MPKGVLRLIRCLPNAASRRRILLEKGPGAFVAIAALSDRLAAPVMFLAGETAAGEAVSMQELASKSLDWCGIPRGLAIATDREEYEAIAQACRQVPPESPFSALSSFAGFHRRMRATLRELRHWGIEPEVLLQIAEGADSPAAIKLRSIAEIEVTARALLDTIGKTFLETRLHRALNARALSDARPGTILLFAGSDASPLYLDWVQWALHQGAEITLVVDGHPNVPDLFEGAKQIEKHVNVRAQTSAEGNSLSLNLFSDQPAMGTDIEAEIFSSGDPLAECEWALRRAQTLAASGVPWNDIAFFSRDARSYWPLLISAATRLVVPIRIARRCGLAENALTRLLMQLSRVVLEDATLGLESLLISSYTQVDPEIKKRFNALLKEMSRDLESSALWTSLKSGATGFESLEDVIAWREGRPDFAPLVDWAAWWKAALQFDWVKKARQTPSDTQARDDGALGAYEDAILTRAGMCATSNADLSPSDFLEVLKDVFESEDFGVPAAAKGLQVVSAADELGDVRSVFVLGMLEGTFPRRRSEDPILSDFERDAISQARPGRIPLRNSHGQAASERDEFLKLCAAPSRSICFSYPQTGEDRDNVPAFYLDEVERCTAGTVARNDHPRTELTPHVETCLSVSDRELAIALDTRPRSGPPNKLFTDKATEALRPNFEEPFTPGELRDAVQCSFRYAFRRRIGVKNDKPELGRAILRSLPQLAALPIIPTPEEAKARLEEVLEAELGAEAEDLSDADIRMVRRESKRLIREWVAHEFNARALWPKDPGSTKAHAAFGQEGLRAEIPSKNRTIKLRGGATAIAGMGDYSVVELLNARRSLAEASKAEDLQDTDALELGLYLLAQWGNKPAAAVEAESIAGQRTLFLLPRRPEQEIEARANQGLRVVDLGEPKEFFPKVKETLTFAVERIDNASIEPNPGDHCRWCEFGELCRSAQGYAEEEVSAIEVVESED